MQNKWKKALGESALKQWHTVLLLVATATQANREACIMIDRLQAED